MPISGKVLKKYSNSIFIETGTCYGNGVKAALNTGFEKIYSIEINKQKFEDATMLFREISVVSIIYGDSREKLKEVLDKISEPVTIWLDGHSAESQLGGCPVLDELKIIGQHPIKSHTILIDDRRLFIEPQGWCGIKYDTIIQYLMKINKRYKISFENGYIKDDIVVAKAGVCR